MIAAETHEGLLAFLSSPHALIVALAMAGMTLLLVLVLLVRKPREGADAGARVLRAETSPPPLLDTALIAPAPASRSRDRPAPLRLFAIGMLGIAALAGIAATFGGEAGPASAEGAGPASGEGERAARAGQAPWAYEGESDPSSLITGVRPAVSMRSAGPCEAGVSEHAEAYTRCDTGFPVRFERLAFARGGERLLHLAWSGEGRRAFVVETPSQPVPFTLDRHTDLLAAPGSVVGDYAAFLAIGTADASRDGEGAGARAEARADALARFALDELRAGGGSDCRSGAVVHAVSLGARRSEEGGPVPEPVLIGVRAASHRGGDVGALDAVLDEFLSGEGAEILGFVPEAYGPWRVSSSERACDRGPV